MPVKYLPRPDLPSPILFALQDPYYQEGLNEHFDQIDPSIRKKFEHHFSVTTVARPPRQRVLSKRYSDRVILDPLGDGFWRMFGHTIHSILQEAAHRDPVLEAEVRLGTVIKVKIAGKVHQVYIHGQADLYDPPGVHSQTTMNGLVPITTKRTSVGMLDDYKITKAESMYYENKDEYIFQLNALAYIWRQNGKPVEAIRNVYLFRNYDPRRYKEGGKYPKEHVAMIDIPIWDDARILKSIEDRVTKHMIAELADDDHLPRCSSAERWESQTSYRAIKIDPKTGEPQKKSKFASEVKMEVHDWIQANSTATDKKGKVTNINYEVREIPGKSVRCDYCEISSFCTPKTRRVKNNHVFTRRGRGNSRITYMLPPYKIRTQRTISFNSPKGSIEQKLLDDLCFQINVVIKKLNPEKSITFAFHNPDWPSNMDRGLGIITIREVVPDDYVDKLANDQAA